jgi:hypothetical protein
MVKMVVMPKQCEKCSQSRKLWADIRRHSSEQASKTSASDSSKSQSVFQSLTGQCAEDALGGQRGRRLPEMHRDAVRTRRRGQPCAAAATQEAGGGVIKSNQASELSE